MDTNDLSGKEILIVEDDQLTFLFIQQVFKRTGMNITRANGGCEAIDISRTNKHFDCILVDIQLPDISGLEVIKSLKPSYPNTPFVAQTASHSQEVYDESIKAGATDFIYKPYKANELLDKIAKLIFKE